jgi:hypothetical protein
MTIASSQPLINASIGFANSGGAISDSEETICVILVPYWFIFHILRVPSLSRRIVIINLTMWQSTLRYACGIKNT